MRQNNWEQRLAEHLTHARTFDAVEYNCAVFALGIVTCMTGEEPKAILARVGVDMPTTLIGVNRVLLESGGVRGLAAAYFGRDERTDRLNARRGDIAIFDGADGDTLGVVDSGGVIGITRNGIRHYPLDCIKGFWSL